MRLATATAFALVPLSLLAWASASQPQIPNEPQAVSRGVDLSRERQLVEEARTEVRVVDLAQARAKASEAIELLLARPESEHDTGWLELVDAAGGVAWDAQDAGLARAAWEKILEVHSRTLPDDHSDLQAARMNFAKTLYRLGDFAAARPLQEKVLEVRSRTLPEDHTDLQKARGNLAATLSTLGDLTAARTLKEKVLEVYARTLPDDHPDLQKARGNLAVTLLALGDLATTRALQEKVLSVYSGTLQEDDPALRFARGNLAITLAVLGDLAAARGLQEKVLEVSSRTLPDDHPDVQVARGNLAATLSTLGDHAAARALKEKVLEVRSRTLPDDHPDLQVARGNLAGTLSTLGDLAAAHALQEKVLEANSRTLPDHHLELQAARLNLAGTLRTLGDHAAARALGEKCVEIFSRTLPDDHSYLQMARGSLALTIAAGRAAEKRGEEERNGEEEGGRETFARLAASFTRAIARSARTAVLTASSREAEERCANSQVDLGFALSFAEGLGVFENDARLEREVFVLSEQTRGAALASAHFSRRASADQRYGMRREAMRSASDELTRLAQQGASADEIDRARSSREAAERELGQLARELSGAKTGILELDPAWLSASISERDAFVGYRRYRRCRYEPGGGNELWAVEDLCAFVLRSGDRLERIELGPVEPIERAVERWREAIGVRRERGVSAASNGADESQLRGEELRMLVFDPLRRALDETDRVVVALDDVLHLVPLDALPLETPPLDARSQEPSAHDPASNQRLGDRWRIETRCTLSELAWKEAALPQREALLALGGASFNLAPLPHSAEESATLDVEQTDTTEAAPIPRGGAWDRGFGPLAHSGPEARGIAELYGEAFDDKRPALVLEKRKASRAALVELAPKARFLHIATHGWFAPESVRSMVDPEPLDKFMGFGSRMSGEERARGMSPMLLCGLALAGANLSEDELGRAPGLITAEEISTLDLTGCELAVLSACDTNVGERRAGQGVASLQKALHMAGARTVITSLWKVPDEATRELMLDFYRRIWIEKKPKGVALWEAKTRIRDAKDERGKPLYLTRDWAAWVLTGDPR